MTIRGVAEGPSESERDLRLVKSLGPILLFILGRKSIHGQDAISGHCGSEAGPVLAVG